VITPVFYDKLFLKEGHPAPFYKEAGPVLLYFVGLLGCFFFLDAANSSSSFFLHLLKRPVRFLGNKSPEAETITAAATPTAPHSAPTRAEASASSCALSPLDQFRQIVAYFFTPFEL
jgi:hypothetical protein